MRVPRGMKLRWCTSGDYVLMVVVSCGDDGVIVIMILLMILVSHSYFQALPSHFLHNYVGDCSFCWHLLFLHH